jgi:lysophospholipase L1-like esterase
MNLTWRAWFQALRPRLRSLDVMPSCRPSRVQTLAIALVVWLCAATPAGARAADWRDAPIVPRIDPSLAGQLRAQLADARAAGNRAGVFAKLGDSITETQAYLQGLACGEQRLAGHADLQPTIAFFHQTRFPDGYTSVWCGHADSFSRASAAATSGQTAEWVTANGAADSGRCRAPESPLACEYRLLRPAWSLVMFGTNDLEQIGDVTRYRQDMNRIVTQSRSRGVIPILSTIPPRLDSAALNRRVNTYNDALYRLAANRGVLLINFWRALTQPGMVNRGMYSDGIHPNVYVSYDCTPFCRPLDFGDQALRYGYNQRNLITLETLDRIRRQVIAG